LKFIISGSYWGNNYSRVFGNLLYPEVIGEIIIQGFLEIYYIRKLLGE
jgi:hypothetical protein